MILQALYQYLVNPAELPGWPAQRFEKPQRVSGVDLYTPNDARRLFQDRTERANIFLGRRPEGSTWGTAVTLLEVNDTPEYGLQGELPGQFTAVELTVYGRGANAASRVDATARLARLCLSGFAGDYWGDVGIIECLIGSGRDDLSEPMSGSDTWDYHRPTELLIYHDSPGAFFPEAALAGDITCVDAVGVGTHFRPVAVMYPATGRPIINVKWDIRLTSHTSAVVVSINGAPDSGINVANVTGPYKSPAFLRSAFGLTGLPVYVTMTLTDDFGSTVVVQKVG